MIKHNESCKLETISLQQSVNLGEIARIKAAPAKNYVHQKREQWVLPAPAQTAHAASIKVSYKGISFFLPTYQYSVHVD